jgi:CTP-dependent riboflavin kinase
MSEGTVLRGKVFSGLGQGGFFTQLDWVRQQCHDKLGFTPFPGTLNLKVEQQYLDVVQKLREQEGVDIIPPVADFCPAKCFPVSISGIRGAIISPHAEGFTEDVHSTDVIELIAPLNIKEALSLEDGASLLITVE